MNTVEFRDVVVRYDKRVGAAGPSTTGSSRGSGSGVIGPNGAGKSSLLRALAGLVLRTGAILVDGRDLCGDVAQGSGLRPRGLRAGGAADPRRHERVRLRAPRPRMLQPCRTSGSRPRHDRAVVGRGTRTAGSWTRFVERLLGEAERRRTHSGWCPAGALAQRGARWLLLDAPTLWLDIGHQQQALELVAQLRHYERPDRDSRERDDLTWRALHRSVDMMDQGAVVASGLALTCSPRNASARSTT